MVNMVIYVRNCDLWLWSNKGNYAELLVEQKYHPLTQTICVSISHPRRRSGRHKLQSGGHRVNRCFGRGFWPNTGKGWEDEAIQWDIFTGLLQIYCDTSLSCEKPWILGEVLPKWLWQDPTEPTKGSVAWWYRAARAQPGHSQGTARGFKWLWFSCEPRCDFPSRMRWWLPLRSCTRGWDNAKKNAGTVAGTCIASLQQTLVEETLKCFQIQINRYQQILFSRVFQLSVNHLLKPQWGWSLSGPFPPLLPSYSSPWPRLCPFWSSSCLGRIRRAGGRAVGRRGAVGNTEAMRAHRALALIKASDGWGIF